jgi:glycosyltransferase involved in cell wall biosynthesis
MGERVPILVVGDAPTTTTGLGRIARDVTELLRRDAEAGRLDVRVAQLGLNYDGRRTNWHVYPITDTESWGQGDIAAAWEDWAGPPVEGDERGVIFTVWDPGRCPAVFGGLNRREPGGTTPMKRWTEEGRRSPHIWGYFAVDAHNNEGKLGGPVPETLEAYQRVLAYGPYGAQVLGDTLNRAVPWLPHGIDTDVFAPQTNLPEVMVEGWRESDWPIIGVVATNTPRKDFGLVFAMLEGLDCQLWIHIDQLVTSAWSIMELAERYGRNTYNKLHVTTHLDDEEMAKWYSVCDATIAPGLGEGWGYPIAESLACGTPVVHVNYAGGAALIPTLQWRFGLRAQRLEGPYALLRPVVTPGEAKETLRGAVRWARDEPHVVEAYCRGAVEHLDWRSLWPYWRGWFQKGLGALEHLGKEAQG